MIKINLLPRETREQVHFKRQLITLISVIVISLSIVIVFWSYLGKKVSILSQEVTEVEKEVEILKKKYKEIEGLKNMETDLITRIKVINNLMAGQRGPAPIFDELVSLIPKHMWLRELNLNNNSISFKGSAFSNNVIADFMRNLEAGSFFKDVDLVETKRETQKNVNIHNFILNCAIVLPQEENKSGS